MYYHSKIKEDSKVTKRQLGVLRSNSKPSARVRSLSSLGGTLANLVHYNVVDKYPDGRKTES